MRTALFKERLALSPVLPITEAMDKVELQVYGLVYGSCRYMELVDRKGRIVGGGMPPPRLPLDMTHYKPFQVCHLILWQSGQHCFPDAFALQMSISSQKHSHW